MRALGIRNIQTARLPWLALSVVCVCLTPSCKTAKPQPTPAAGQPAPAKEDADLGWKKDQAAWRLKLQEIKNQQSRDDQTNYYQEEIDGLIKKKEEQKEEAKFAEEFQFLKREKEKWKEEQKLAKKREELNRLHARKVQDILSEVGSKMDYADQYVQEYGSSSISVPLLSKLGEDFTFNLKQGGTNYYNDAKSQVQNAAASFQQTVQSLSMAGQAQLDPTVAAAYAAQLGDYFSSLERFKTKQSLQDQAALQELHGNLAAANANSDPSARQAAVAQALQTYSQQYSAPTNAPTFPTDTGSGTNLPAAAQLPGRPSVTNVLAGQQFLPFQGLLNGMNLNPTVNDRFAIITAAGDVATESIFRHFMGSTNKDDLMDNVYFGFISVSVSPGWRTSRGWEAEVTMAAEIDYTEARMEVVKGVFTQETPGIKAKLYKHYGVDNLPSDPQARDLFAQLNKRSMDSASLLAIAEIMADNPDTASGIRFKPEISYQPGLSQYLSLEIPVTETLHTNMNVWNVDLGTAQVSDVHTVTNREALYETAELYLSEGVDNSVQAEQLSVPFDPVALQLIQRFRNQPAASKVPFEQYLSQISTFVTNKEVTMPCLVRVPTNVLVLNLSALTDLAQEYLDAGVTSFKSAAVRHRLDLAPTALLLAENAAYEAEKSDAGAKVNVLKYALKHIMKETAPHAGLFHYYTNTPPTQPMAVTIISPLIDSEVQDLSSSQRSQAEFALALSFALRYAGLGGQAAAFEQFVKNKQFDIRTRAPDISVNAFSGNNGKFGFQIGPQLTAIQDPTGKNRAPGKTLERQSFPALLILQLGAAEIKPVLRDDGIGGVGVLEPQLKFTLTRRWTPLTHGFLPKGNWLLPVNWFHPVITEERRLYGAALLHEAASDMDVLSCQSSCCLPEALTNGILKRIETLQGQMVGSEGHVLLSLNTVIPTTPSVESVAITEAYPKDLLLTTPSLNTVSFAFLGSGLNQISREHTNVTVFTNVLAGAGLDIADLQSSVSASMAGQALMVSVKLNRKETTTNTFALVFQLITTNNTKILTPPIYVRYIPVSAPDGTSPVLHITQSADTAGKAIDYKVEIGDLALPEDVDTAAKLIQADMAKNTPRSGQSSNTVMSILVNETKAGTVSATAAASVTNAPGPKK